MEFRWRVSFHCFNPSQVEAVEELPGQDSALQPGDVIIGISVLILDLLFEARNKYI